MSHIMLSTCRNCAKRRHKWSECWAKGGGAAKQANSVGDTEKTGDVNWTMMIQQLNDGKPSREDTKPGDVLGSRAQLTTHINLTPDPNL